jgi:hypothetical protein
LTAEKRNFISLTHLYIKRIEFFFLFQVSCEEISAPSSGSFAISSNGTESTVTYSCDTGYILVGEGVRSCNSGGQWMSNTPECGECCHLPTIYSYLTIVVSLNIYI